MNQKTQNLINVCAFLVAFAGLAFAFFTRTQDKTEEFFEKEAHYRTKTLEYMQSIKEDNQKALQAFKNDVYAFKLKTQETNFKNEKKIENLEIKSDHLKNQFEHLHSQTKADNQVLKNELKNWSEKEFKKKNE